MMATSERLSLEVCLFDNNAYSSFYLLGRGTLPLTPEIVTGHPGQPKLAVRHVKEVILLEPITGNIMSTVQLEMAFLGELEAPSAPAMADGTMTSNVTWYPQKVIPCFVTSTNSVFFPLEIVLADYTFLVILRCVPLRRADGLCIRAPCLSHNLDSKKHLLWPGSSKK